MPTKMYRRVVLTLFVGSLAAYFAGVWYRERMHVNEWRLSSIQMSLLKTPGIEIDFQKLWDNGDIRHYQVMPPDKQQRFCEYVSQELGIADPEYFQLFMEHYDQVAQTKDPVFQKASLRYVVDFAERIWKEKHAVREEHARLSSEGL